MSRSGISSVTRTRAPMPNPGPVAGSRHHPPTRPHAAPAGPCRRITSKRPSAVVVADPTSRGPTAARPARSRRRRPDAHGGHVSPPRARRPGRGVMSRAGGAPATWSPRGARGHHVTPGADQTCPPTRMRHHTLSPVPLRPSRPHTQPTRTTPAGPAHPPCRLAEHRRLRSPTPTRPCPLTPHAQIVMLTDAARWSLGRGKALVP
jgi:hypothetical protein